MDYRSKNQMFSFYLKREF